MTHFRFLVRLAGCVVLLSGKGEAAAEWADQVAADHPVAWWDFEPGGPELDRQGTVDFVPGPRAETSANLAPDNRAAFFGGNGDFIRVPDAEALRFDNGDAITIEAWIRLDGNASSPYIVGKGRLTTRIENQNWALRLTKVGAGFRISFLFRSRAGEGLEEEFHRWNSDVGIAPGPLWHHVAVVYRFGEPESIRAFLDGEKSGGTWDLGGATKREPVVDDAEVWIGSSRGGAEGNSWSGALDEVAVYRSLLPDETLAARVDFGPGIPEVDWAAMSVDSVRIEVFGGLSGHAWPARHAGAPELLSAPSLCLLELPRIYTDHGSRQRRGPTLLRLAARVEFPEGERQFLLRAPSLARLRIDGETVAEMESFQMNSDAHQSMRPPPEDLPYPRARLGTRDVVFSFTSSGGAHEVLLEAVVGHAATRFTLGELLVAGNEGGEWKLLGPAEAEIRPFAPVEFALYREAQTAAFAAESDSRRREVRARLAPEWEERHAVARAYVAALPSIPVPDLPPGFTARNPVDHFLAAKIDASRKSEAEQNSHASLARDSIAILEEQCFRCHGQKDKGDLRLNTRSSALAAGESGRSAIVPGEPGESEVVRRLLTHDEDERMPPKGDGLSGAEVARLKEWIGAGAPWEKRATRVRTPPVLNDAAFLRRLFLDTVGILPTPDQLRAFAADASEDKVERRVDLLLADPRHADHGTGYWQDVLAENPRLVKGMLNNTGPFRWWINEALRDKLPFDVFVRELINFDGAGFEGGAAGFKVATENDAPMADKAHILATAFLGTEMKCARCHDAPYHRATQKDLFAIAAMLEGKPVSVPSSATVPASFFARIGDRKPLVNVTLKPGVPVTPEWPFTDLTDSESGVVPAPSSPRERLAWELTRPENRRFAQVIVNRMWKQYFGQGFVEPVHDWEGNKPSHPNLLAWLARDFVANGYDLDRLSKWILTSDAYRRVARTQPALAAEERLFEAPLRRRLSSEQLVDSLFAATGVPVYSEELTFDIPGASPAETFPNLGRPTRAWQFVSLASDRDRPSLTLPHADSIVSVMGAFGWRADRSEPVTERMDDATVLQPGMLANGVFGTWMTRLSPYSDLTRLAVNAPSPEQLVEDLYLRFLSRLPAESERKAMVLLLAEDFSTRLLKPAAECRMSVYVPPVREVSWSNHLSPEANFYAAEIEKEAAMGPPAADFLDPGWRARMEDAVWALINAPEMQFVP